MSLRQLAEKLSPFPALAVTGPGAERFYPELAKPGAPALTLISAPQCFPEAAVIVDLARERLKAGGDRPEAVIPLYVRRTQAEEMLARKAGQGVGEV